jgi:hypothetical protein
VDRCLHEPRHQARAHHCLPPSELWDGGVQIKDDLYIHMVRALCGTLTSLGAHRPACCTQGGFCCLNSRAGHWVTTYPPWPANLCAGSSRGQGAAATHAASIHAAAPNTPPVHLAQSEHVYVRVGGQQKPLAAPYAGPGPARPIPGGLQGGQRLLPSRWAKGRRSSLWMA